MSADPRHDASDGPRPDLDEPERVLPINAAATQGGGPQVERQVETRAAPLPEEAAAGDVGNRRAEAAEILRDSEERIAEVFYGNAPSDAAAQSRRSDETV
jgi:hypothetical protein